MRLNLSRSFKFFTTVSLIAITTSLMVSRDSRAANFGIHFGGDCSFCGGWGPYYLNQVGAHGAGPYPSAFGVTAANWYEPGAISQTTQLPGSPTSVNFKPASMGSGSVNFAWSSAHPDTGPQNGYTFVPYGFANANRFVMQTDGSGNKILDGDGHYIPVTPEQLAPDNGVPVSGEHAVLAGALFATDGVEYAPEWGTKRDIVVTITGMSSIASGYTVKLLASAQNGDTVEGFTPATIADNASHTANADFTLLPDRPSYWSPFDPDPANPYVSIAGVAESATVFTGDSVEIRLSGGNEYFNEEFEFVRTVLAGVIIDYTPLSTPSLPGDYNSNGTVDAADYVVWRNGGSPDSTLAGYTLWRSNYGNHAGSGLGESSAVPEPSMIVLAAMGALGLAGFRRSPKRS